jgi:hypothetical protein
VVATNFGIGNNKKRILREQILTVFYSKTMPVVDFVSTIVLPGNMVSGQVEAGEISARLLKMECKITYIRCPNLNLTRITYGLSQ